MSSSNSTSGHRERLRRRFREAPNTLSDIQLLELLLSFAIPRRDVAPIAEQLMVRFGDLNKVFAASDAQWLSITGVGDAALTLLRVVDQIQDRKGLRQNMTSGEKRTENYQPELFASDDEAGGAAQLPFPKPPPPPPTKADIRAFTNDLIKVVLIHLPDVVECDGFLAFLAHLEHHLPYNSAYTRNRYARYLTNRYYPAGRIDTPLTRFLSFAPDASTWKAVLFYETARAEPAIQFTAEEVLWPILPVGHIERDVLKESLQKRFYAASEGTIKRMIYSLVNLYTLLDVALLQGSQLQLQTRPGTLPAFVYVLAAEFSQPGIYTFEALEKGPMRRWLLWDREWVRRQLYNLRDMGVIAKISEIDAMRQFTLSTQQMATIEHYFEHPRRDELALREAPVTGEVES